MLGGLSSSMVSNHVYKGKALVTEDKGLHSHLHLFTFDYFLAFHIHRKGVHGEFLLSASLARS